jgi:hypothetical protein
MQIRYEQALVVAVVLLNAYCFGANCVERFVNYQTWDLIPAEAFEAYHKAQQPLIQVFVVAPMAVGFFLQIWLVLRTPAGVERIAAWAMIVASLAGAVSTVTLQLPIHSALNQGGYSAELLSKLLRTDWIRKAADAVRIGATGVLLYQLLSVH